MLNRNIFERIILTRVKSIKATKLAHMYRVSYAKKSNNNFFLGGESVSDGFKKSSNLRIIHFYRKFNFRII